VKRLMDSDERLTKLCEQCSEGMGRLIGSGDGRPEARSRKCAPSEQSGKFRRDGVAEQVK